MTKDWFELVRRLVVMAAVMVMMMGAWSMVTVIAVVVAFGTEETWTWIFVGLPTALIVFMFFWKRLPRVLGFE
jgi:hypothetical protein